MNKYIRLTLCLLFTASSVTTCLGIDPNIIVGVEHKSGKEDQGIAYFEDMSFGVSGKTLVGLLRDLGANNLRIPIMNEIRPDQRGDVIVDNLKKIHQSGGQDIGVILSVRRWDLHVEKQQVAWCDDIAYVFNEIRKAGLDSMVVGCAFDENGNLRDKQSNRPLWDKRHQGVLKSLDRLNRMTDDAFKTRTVFIHGKGMGSQFKGVKASSRLTDFPTEMKKRCKNYCYSFKFFQTGMPDKKDIESWKAWFNQYCAFSEVAELGVPMVFVGDSGDGIRGRGFEPDTNSYGRCGPHVMHALASVFRDHGWTGFSFGLFVAEPKGIGRTALHKVKDCKAHPEKNNLICWKTWQKKIAKK